jgi:hypothetical protein
LAAAAWKSSSIASIRGEWNAWLTASRRDRSNRSATASTPASSPDTTTADGPFTAAIDTPGPSSGAISSSVATSATIAPPRGNACIKPLRAETRVTASSRESTPATWAATSSPIEWPIR